MFKGVGDLLSLASANAFKGDAVSTARCGSCMPRQSCERSCNGTACQAQACWAAGRTALVQHDERGPSSVPGAAVQKPACRHCSVQRLQGERFVHFRCRMWLPSDMLLGQLAATVGATERSLLDVFMAANHG